MTKLSVVTPSHSARFLKRVAWSIAQQSSLPDEWLICVNGPLSIGEALRETRDVAGKLDLRVIRAPGDATTIGSLKRFGFMEASGDRLVELDHDDVVAPDCIAELRKAFDAGAEFVYSNMAAFVGDDWDADGFWPSNTVVRPCAIYGRDLLQNAPEFTPHNILLASHSGPCHVRAWTKEFYVRLGGHDVTLNWTEDLELLSRTYLARPNVVHIDRPLYAFYVDPSRDRDQHDVIDETARWTKKHALNLVREWCARNAYRVVEPARDLSELGARAGLVVIEGEATERRIRAAWETLRHGGFLSLKVRDFGTVARYWFPLDRSETARFQLSYGFPRDGVIDVLMVADKGEGQLAGVNHWTPRINEAEVLRWVSVLKTYGASWQVSEGRCLLYGEEARKAAALLERIRPGCFIAVEGVPA